MSSLSQKSFWNFQWVFLASLSELCKGENKLWPFPKIRMNAPSPVFEHPLLYHDSCQESTMVCSKHDSIAEAMAKPFRQRLRNGLILLSLSTQAFPEISGLPCLISLVCESVWKVAGSPQGGKGLGISEQKRGGW